MVDGLWIVQYEGVAGGDGGVIVFVRGQVLGGDNAYVYTGKYQSDNETLMARVVVRNFNPMITNVLGVEGDFELAVSGTIRGEIIKGSASLLEQPGPTLALKLTKVAGLAF